MEEEINDHQQIIKNQEIQIAELKESVGLKEKECAKERRLNKETHAFVRRIRTELHHAAGLVQEPLELKKAVIVSFALFCIFQCYGSVLKKFV